MRGAERSSLAPFCASRYAASVALSPRSISVSNAASTAEVSKTDGSPRSPAWGDTLSTLMSSTVGHHSTPKSVATSRRTRKSDFGKLSLTAMQLEQQPMRHGRQHFQPTSTQRNDVAMDKYSGTTDAASYVKGISFIALRHPTNLARLPSGFDKQK